MEEGESPCSDDGEKSADSLEKGEALKEQIQKLVRIAIKEAIRQKKQK